MSRKMPLAAQIGVWIQAEKQHVDLPVINGIGLGGSMRRSGLAYPIDGQRDCDYLDVGDSLEGGLRLQWSIPIRR